MAIPAYPATDASCVYVPGAGRYLDAVLADLCKLDVLLRVRGLPGTSVTLTLGDAAVQSRIGASGVEMLRLPALGLWDMHVAKDAYAYDVQVPVYRYGITEAWALAQKPFYDCTPEEIGAICEAGQAGRFWRVGDEHKITLKSGEEVTVQIADFDHDVGPDGQVLPLTLVTKGQYSQTGKMNSGQTNTGGWEKSMMRTETIPGILANWPEDWRKIMAVATKLSGGGGATTAPLVATEDTLWLFSKVEICGDSTTTTPGQGTQYPIFTDNASRIKLRGGAAAPWWLRSQAGTDKFHDAESSGGTTYDLANGAKGIVCGFCVGGTPTVPEAPDEGGAAKDCGVFAAQFSISTEYRSVLVDMGEDGVDVSKAINTLDPDLFTVSSQDTSCTITCNKKGKYVLALFARGRNGTGGELLISARAVRDGVVLLETGPKGIPHGTDSAGTATLELEAGDSLVIQSKAATTAFNSSMVYLSLVRL